MVCHFCHIRDSNLKQFPPWQLPIYLKLAGSSTLSDYLSTRRALTIYCINVISLVAFTITDTFSASNFQIQT